MNLDSYRGASFVFGAASIKALRASAVHPLRLSHFRNYWLGATISLFGDQFYLVALPWLVLQLSGSSLALGTILMSAAVPRAVLMVMGGFASDRWSPRRILIGTASARALLVAAIAALTFIHAIRIWHIYLLAFAFGVADAFSFPALQALVPRIVSPDQLPAANSAIQGSAQASTMLGPAPAGIVVKSWGIAQAFFVDAFSFLFVIVALFRMPEPVATTPAAEPDSLGRQPQMSQAILEGLRYVVADPQVRILMLLSAVVNLCLTGPILVGLATMAKFVLASSTAFGIWFSSYSGGALLGTILAGFFKRPQKRGILLLSVAVGLGLGLVSIGMSHTIVGVAVILALMGLGSGFVNITVLAWLQSRIERRLLGRVMSLLMFAAVGLAPLSYAVAGAVAQIYLQAMFLAAGALMILVAGIGLMNRAARSID